MYVETLPAALSQIQESDLGFRSVYSDSAVTASRLRPVTIEFNHQDGHIESDFKIGFWEKDVYQYILIRLEINYRRINFNLYLTADQVREICSVAEKEISKINTSENTKKVLEALGHSLSGATYAERAQSKKGEDDSSEGQTGYKFNDKMIVRELDDVKYLCVVAMKGVSSGFIWDSGERFYFCFDLMLMLRAMIDECPLIATPEQCAFCPSPKKKTRNLKLNSESVFEICVILVGLIGVCMTYIFNKTSFIHLPAPKALSDNTLAYAGLALVALSLLCELGLKLTQIKNRK